MEKEKGTFRAHSFAFNSIFSAVKPFGNFCIKYKMPIFRAVYHYIKGAERESFFILKMKQKILIRLAKSPTMIAIISRVLISFYYPLYSYLSYTRG